MYAGKTFDRLYHAFKVDCGRPKDSTRKSRSHSGGKQGDESFGAKVLAQYATLGAYDFVNIVDAPDNKTIAKVSVELGSRGTVEITMLPALMLSDFVATVKGK